MKAVRYHEYGSSTVLDQIAFTHRRGPARHRRPHQVPTHPVTDPADPAPTPRRSSGS